MEILGYHVYYDEEVNEFVLENKKSVVHRERIKKNISIWIVNRNKAFDVCDDLNKRLNNGELKVIKCSSCNELFALTKYELQWYKSKRYKLPKRCDECRENEKHQKKVVLNSKEDNNQMSLCDFCSKKDECGKNIMSCSTSDIHFS